MHPPTCLAAAEPQPQATPPSARRSWWRMSRVSVLHHAAAAADPGPLLAAVVGKAYMSDALIEAGFLSALAEWLKPLSDGSCVVRGLMGGR